MEIERRALYLESPLNEGAGTAPRGGMTRSPGRPASVSSGEAAGTAGEGS